MGQSPCGAANDPRLVKVDDRVRLSAAEIPLVGALGDLVKSSAGSAGFHPQLMDETMASAILPSQRTAIRRAGGTAKYNAVGDIARLQLEPGQRRPQRSSTGWSGRTAPDCGGTTSATT
jgi:hypothetical protein